MRKAKGQSLTYGDIPVELKADDSADIWREKMLEAAAEASETLMNKYLESGDLTEAEIKQGHASATLSRRNCSDAMWFGLQEQGCAGYAGCGD
jgi:translation elongation factor EF-G